MNVEIQLALVVLACLVSGFAFGVYFRPSYYITVKAPDVTVYLLVRTSGQGHIQEWRMVDPEDWWKNGEEHPRGEEPA